MYSSLHQDRAAAIIGGSLQTAGEPSIPETGSKKQEDSATIPSVRVDLIQSVRILPRESVSVSVQVCGEPSEEPFLMERDSDTEQCLGVQVSESLMQPDSEQRACV